MNRRVLAFTILVAYPHTLSIVSQIIQKKNNIYICMQEIEKAIEGLESVRPAEIKSRHSSLALHRVILTMSRTRASRRIASHRIASHAPCHPLLSLSLSFFFT